ncbi:hypothetical protein I553_5208 [Mycobacterium xenopi 4042]|uniref:Uncharacterized protein n=1 Tax=Mycobacterium xenopi 4042 TaxID=1299334 RepID=X7ZYZ9_MYCXE|nr:hypothetical protein I553_5208 [Mycobacterium xenopi 4042]
MFVLDVVVFVRGVHVGVSDVAVLVLVRMRRLVTVVMVGHRAHLPCCAVVSEITCSPASLR